MNPTVAALLDAVTSADRSLLGMGLAVLSGFMLGRFARAGGRAPGEETPRRLPPFQNAGEVLVTRLLREHFPAPDHHLMNHITLRMDDGTTQVDHILVSRFGVFVIETKYQKGWIHASATDRQWTNVRHHRRFTFQNPIHQNYRHLVAVQRLLPFVPAENIHSVVVFAGTAEFMTPLPEGVVHLDGLVEIIRRHRHPVLTHNRLQFVVGRLEMERLALSHRTDVEHVEHLRRRFGTEVQ